MRHCSERQARVVKIRLARRTASSSVANATMKWKSGLHAAVMMFLVAGAAGYFDGAPRSSCEQLRPIHRPHEPQSMTNPYHLSFLDDVADYGCGDTVTSKSHSGSTKRLNLVTSTRSWWRGTVVERWSLAGELSRSCARPAADG